MLRYLLGLQLALRYLLEFELPYLLEKDLYLVYLLVLQYLLELDLVLDPEHLKNMYSHMLGHNNHNYRNNNLKDN